MSKVIKVITATGAGNWVCPAGTRSIRVTGVGGGGGGGGGERPLTATTKKGSGGSGGGAAVMGSVVMGVTPGTTYPYSVGTGGAGGAGGASDGADGVNGVDGGDTSFNAEVYFRGAAGGVKGKDVDGADSDQLSLQHSGPVRGTYVQKAIIQGQGGTLDYQAGLVTTPQLPGFGGWGGHENSTNVYGENARGAPLNTSGGVATTAGANGTGTYGGFGGGAGAPGNFAGGFAGGLLVSTGSIGGAGGNDNGAGAGDAAAATPSTSTNGGGGAGGGAGGGSSAAATGDGASGSAGGDGVLILEYESG